MEPSYLIVGNWKMNPSRAKAESLAIRIAEGTKDIPSDVSEREFVICPPFPLLGPVGEKVRGTRVSLGAQDCHAKKAGLHTGDVSALLLRDMGCTHVIVGHSERRKNHRESNTKVRVKAQAAIDAGLVAIICVGENEDERKAGTEKAREVVEKQLRGSLPAFPGDVAAEAVAVAYEPVWAIGTGKTATPEDIAEMHAHIRKILGELVEDSEAVRILYGGSVKPSNAGEILEAENVNGVLVGGASLSAEGFIEIAGSYCAVKPAFSYAGVT